MLKEIHCRVSGRVQLVMFRDFTTRKARGLGLTGTVQNKDDGTVEVVAQGEEEKLKKLIIKLHKGSLLSRVDSVSVDWITPTQTFHFFNILY